MTGRLVLASLALYPAAWDHPNVWTGGWTLTLGAITFLTTGWALDNGDDLAALRHEIADLHCRWAFTAALILLLALLAITTYLVTLLTWPVVAALLLGHTLNTLNHVNDRRPS